MPLHKLGLYSTTELCVNLHPFFCAKYVSIHLYVVSHVYMNVHDMHECGGQMIKLGASFQAHSTFLFETASSTGIKLTK